MWRLRFYVGWQLMVILTILSCRPQQDVGEVASVYEPAAASAGGRYNVCWAEGESREALFSSLFAGYFLEQEFKPKMEEARATQYTDSEPVSQTIKDAVRQGAVESWTLGDSGFSFESWVPCPNVKTREMLLAAGFHIAIVNTDPKWSTGATASSFGQAEILRVGDDSIEFRSLESRRAVGIALTVKSNVICKEIALNQEQCLAVIAAHEFGHLIGLRHEDIHPAAAADPICRAQGAPAPEPLSQNTVCENYDRASIMNRCHLIEYLKGNPQSASIDGRSSAQDRATSKKLSLGKSPKLPAGNCKK
jgi:hypothetical protein